ncbi:MAG: relaxase domain-containing protein, partial [Alphaproteobacteria bacterium]|nr:relaxase domain-containing protein [Alphaproteobacteria bacterium]
MVANVTKINSARSVVSYFVEDGYYAAGDPEHRKASRWHGRGAAALGLGRHVSPKRFAEIMRGEAPKAGVRLGTVRDGVLVHEAGRDVTLSAPKSVSLAALVDGDKRVVRAHDEAVRATLDWIEEELLLTRQWDRERRRHRRVRAPGMVAAVFRHLANRNLDPQLHSHAVIANMTLTDEGEWRSPDLGALASNEMLIGAFYRNELAARVAALGYDLEPSRAGHIPSFEIRGYGRPVLRSFSTRRRDILRWVEKHGVRNTASRRQQAALATRPRKAEPDRAAMTAMWAARAREMGLPTRKAQAMRRRRRRIHATAVDGAALSAQEVVWRGMEQLEERNSVFTARSLETLALGHSPGSFHLPALRAAVRGLVRDGHLVAAKKRRDPSFATDRIFRGEKDVVARMRAGLGEGAATVAEAAVDRGLAASGLTEGQKRAVRHILCSHDRILGVQGYAGTGKTAMLREAVRLAGAGRVIGLAPTAVAARAMGEEAGMPARTLAWFLARFGGAADGLIGEKELARLRRRYAGTVLVLDEASMVGTVQMQALMRIAETLGVGRLALVGDTAQLRAVDAGGPFRLLQRAGMPIAVMDEILRQRTPELRAAVDAALDREPALAVERLGGDVHEVNAGQLGETAARIWLGLDDAARAETALLAPTHELRERINEAVREALAEEGVLHGRRLTIERLVSRGMTRAQKGDIRNYAEGDEVIFLHDIWGGKARAGECFAVTGIKDGRVRLEHGDGRRLAIRPDGRVRYQVEVYETRTIEIRAGDMIRWTRNDPARGLANGDRAEVVEIGPRRVSFMGEDGRAFSLSRRDMQLRHLDHAWSSTVHGAQGITRDNVVAVLDSGHGALTDQATFYVELTRARDRVVVLTDNREDLMAALEAATGERVSALEAVGEDPAVGIMDREELWPQLSAWRAHEARAAAAGLLPLDMEGHGEVIARLGRLAARRNLPCPPPAAVARILEEQQAEATRRAEVEDWLEERGEREAVRAELAGEAEAAGVPLTDMAGWREWRDEAERRAKAGRRLLDGGEYRPHVEPAGGAPSDIEREAGALEAAVALDDECGALLEDWRAHGNDAEAAGIHPFHGEGYGALAARLEEIAGRPDLPLGTSACLTALLEEHEALVLAGQAVRNVLPSYREMDERRAGLLAEAEASGVPVTD